MPPEFVKTIRDLIFWEYARLISDSALSDSNQFPLITNKFKELQTGLKWPEILLEDIDTDATKCCYCNSSDRLSYDNIVPERICQHSEIHNLVKVCKTCSTSRDNKGLMTWWGWERRDELSRIVYGKYLKMLYKCHECKETLEQECINMDGAINLLDLEVVFEKTCEPKRVEYR